VNYTHKFDVNNKTTRTDLKFAVNIVAIATVAILTIGSTVVAYADTGFNNGYAKGKFDITHGHPLNDTCLPKGLTCDQFHSGYVTVVNQYAYHCKLCVPNNMTLLIVNKTGSIPSGMVHTADGYTDGYNKGRSNTLNNHSFSDLCLSTPSPHRDSYNFICEQYTIN